MRQDRNNKILFSAGGGKGGVGKSIFSVALGVLLAQNGHDVALVDLDLGAANLHTYLGIIKKTPTIADFILRKVSSLEDILLDTSQDKLKVISGAEFVPGMANPAHWMKLKIMRHVKSLPADIIIMDLGAGVHFNILDFFSLSNGGIVVTAPEPGAVLNAYSFIKGALFRKLQKVFKKHPEIGPIIDGETKKTDGETKFTLEWLAEQIRNLDPEVFPVIQEIAQQFCPFLVVNRIPEGQKHVLVQNLIILCREKLGLSLEHIGNLPDTPEITHHLLNIPQFLETRYGRRYRTSVQTIADNLLRDVKKYHQEIKNDFSDVDVETIISLMDMLDDSIFSDTNRTVCKLRMYFKPRDVVNFLISRGVTNELFYGD